MKKSSFYRSTAAAVVAVMTAGALSFTSCETFDDSQIQSSLDDLNSRVETIEEQLAALQGDVDALKTLLDGGKVINSITSNADGTEYTITYVGENVEPDIITVGTSEPVITYIEDNGTLYWAIVNSDGEAEYILGEDNKIPVESADPKMQVAESGELQISIDGGSKWVNTGVSDTDICVFSKVEQDIENGVVTFTLADGETTFKVPMTTELTCEFLSGKTIFEEGETKRLLVDAGGFDKYELAVPQGWIAEFDGTAVSLTAPDQWTENYEDEGEVILRVYNTAAKEVLMDKIFVQLGGMQQISVATEIVKGVVNIVVTPMWPMALHLGVMPASEFSVSAAAKAAGDDTLIPDTAFETDGAYRVPFTEYIENPVVGESYVIWFVKDNYGEEVLAEDIMTEVIDYGVDVELSVGETPTFNNVDINVTPTASTEYYYGIAATEEYYPESLLMMIGNGRYNVHTETIDSDLQTIISVNNDVDENNDDYALPSTVNPGAQYIVWALVKNDAADYSVEDFKTVEFTLAGLQTGGIAQVTFGTLTATAETVEITYTVPDNCYEVHIEYISDADYASYYGSADAVTEYLLDSPAAFVDGQSSVYSMGNLEPNTQGKIYAVVIDNDGKIGSLVSAEADTQDVPHNTEIGIATNGAATTTSSTISQPVTIKGTASEVIYYMDTKQAFEEHWSYAGDVDKVLDEMALNPSYYAWEKISVSSIENNTLVFEGLDFSEEYVIIATVVSTVNGKTLTSDKHIHITATTADPVIIASTDPAYADAVPAVSDVAYIPAEFGGGNVTATVTAKNDTDTWYYYLGEIDGSLTGTDLVRAVMQYGRLMTGSQEVSGYSYDTNPNIYVMLVASDGTIYEPVVTPVPVE